MAGVAERGGEDTAGSGSGQHEAGGRQGRTKGTFTRHTCKFIFLYLNTAGSRPGEQEAVRQCCGTGTGTGTGTVGTVTF